MDIENLLTNLKTITSTITLIYIWFASFLYLFYNVNVIASKTCFYSGLSFITLCIITAQRPKKLFKWLSEKIKGKRAEE